MSEHTDSRWSELLSNALTIGLDSQSNTTEDYYLNDNYTQRFLSRYFDAFYFIDVGKQHRNDYCILKHSNLVCVMGLACGHHLFNGCAFDENGSAVCGHNILGFDFQVQDDINHLNSQVKGRRKHGGHVLNKSTDLLAYAICDRKVKHPIACTIPGRLLEVNNSIIYNSTENDPIELNPLGGFCGSSNVLNNGTYLCITMPNYVTRGGLDKLKKSKVATDEKCANNCFDFVEQVKNLSPHQKICNWEEYCTLRNISA